LYSGFCYLTYLKIFKIRPIYFNRIVPSKVVVVFYREKKYPKEFLFAFIVGKINFVVFLIKIIFNGKS